MKYLKKFNESVQNNMNECYFDLIYLLQDVFDDLDIAPKTDENLSCENPPEHKFWSIRLVDFDDPHNDITNISELGDRDIKLIVVFNVKEDEKESFKERLDEISDRFTSQTGMELKLKEEVIDEGYVYDYVIEIKNK